MKLEHHSKNLLAVTKSKAKMYEFGVAEEHHLAFKENPEILLVLAISILGELSSLTIKHNCENIDALQLERQDLKIQLAICAQYFDALDQSKLTTNSAIYLRILGSAAYYLSDMPGSSGILIKNITPQYEGLTTSELEKFLTWLLVGDYTTDFEVELGEYDDISKSISYFFCKYIYTGKLLVELYRTCDEFRQQVYSVGSDRELLLADVIYAVIIRKVVSSSTTCLPLYTGLALEQWTEALQKESFVREFWPAQRLIGEEGVLSGRSAAIQMPTSAGKTKSIELIIRSSFLSGRSRLAVIVAPFRALCREISDSLKQSFDGESIVVNELLDVPQLDDADKEFISFFYGEEALDEREKNSIVISTPEKLVYILRHQPDLANEIGLLIFDEGHQFDTGSRGITYELLLASLKKSVSDGTQMVLISAVMSNAETIGDWLYGEQGAAVHGTHCLPTQRSIAFSSWTTKRGQLKYVDHDAIDKVDYFVPRLIEEINLGRRPGERNDRVFPDKNSRSKSSHMSAYWGLRLCSQGPVAIFCGLKSSVNTICSLIVDQYERGLEIPAPAEFSNVQELSKIEYLATQHLDDCSEIPKAIRLGVLPHSANIPSGIRLAGEHAMQDGSARLVVCTSTLAQGVNLPIKYLIVSGIYQAGEKISIRDFHNLIGRAGRSGLHTEGSVIFSSPDIFDKKKTYKGVRAWGDIKRLLDFDNAEHCTSSLKKIIEPFPDIPGLDVIDYIANRESYRAQVINYIQKQRLDINSALYNLSFREQALEAIESFLLATISGFEEEIPENSYLEIVQGTLAYSMATEDERLLLEDAFKLIFSMVLDVPEEKRKFYGKALLGIGDLNKISSWLDENYDWLDFDDSLEGTLSYIWELIITLCKNDKIKKLESIEPLENDEAVLVFAKSWINQKAYHELVGELSDQGVGYKWGQSYRKVTIEHVIELADKVLGYDCMLIIGAIADIVEGVHGEVKACETLRVLQKAIKYGLNQPLAIWLYEKGYADREVCKDITEALVASGVNPENFNHDVLESNKDTVNAVLDKYPSYFSKFR